MNKKFCIANWKMYLNLNQSISFIESFDDNILNDNCEIVICPSYVNINSIASKIGNNYKIKIGSQDISSNKGGPFTGEVSLDMLLEVNCSYTIIGHSERRLNHGENNHKINQKLSYVDDSKITPIVCIGETLEEKEAGETKNVLNKQISEIFNNNSGNVIKDCLIAYEPIWAIGTGISADMKTIEEIHFYIKNIIQKIAENYRNIYLLYGGSVNEDNASDILSLNNVDGFLIGSSSTDPKVFNNICNKF